MGLKGEPKTELGRMFRNLAKEAVDLQRKNEAETASFDMDKVLTVERFTSKEGIAAARQDLKKYGATMDRFYDDLAGVLDRMARFSKEVGDDPGEFDAVKKQTAGIKGCIREVVQLANKLLDVTEKHHPTATLDKQNFVFENEAGLLEFNKAGEALEKKQAELRALIQHVDKGR